MCEFHNSVISAGKWLITSHINSTSKIDLEWNICLNFRVYFFIHYKVKAFYITSAKNKFRETNTIRFV